MKTRVSILAPGILFLFSMVLFSCSKVDTIPEVPNLTFEEKLQKTLDKGINQYDGKGISLAVVFSDGSITKSVSGISHDDVEINPDMLFSAGSITKMYTSAIILQYIQENKFELEDSIYHWFPDYENIDNTINIRQLLNHTCGIYNITENNAFWELVFLDPSAILDKENVVRSFTIEPYFSKGTKWKYSNTSYVLLRMLIEKISGNMVSEEYRTRLLSSNNLNHTYCAIEESLPKNTAHGWFDLNGDNQYDDLPAEYLKTFYSAAGGGIFCTAEELALWVKKLFIEKTILNQEMLDQMLILNPTGEEEFRVEAYGLGVTKFDADLFNGLEIYGHGGNPIGYAAACFYLPAYNICIGVMDNTENGNTMEVIPDLLDIIINEVEI